MKTLLKIILVLLACQPVKNAIADTHNNANQLQFAFITCSVDARFFEPVKKGMHHAATMLNIQCDFIGTEGVDLQAQADMVMQAAQDGYDGIALNIIDPKAFDEVVQHAIDVGVPVVGFNVNDHATPNARLASVNQQLFKAGQSQAEDVLPHISENSHILMTMHDKGVSALEGRLAGLQSILKKKNAKITKANRIRTVTLGSDYSVLKTN